MILEHALFNVATWRGKEGQGETTPPPPFFSTPPADGGVEFCRTLAGSASGTGGGSVVGLCQGALALNTNTHTEERDNG